MNLFNYQDTQDINETVPIPVEITNYEVPNEQSKFKRSTIDPSNKANSLNRNESKIKNSVK